MVNHFSCFPCIATLGSIDSIGDSNAIELNEKGESESESKREKESDSQARLMRGEKEEEEGESK